MQAFSLFSVLFLALIVYHKMAFNAVISRLSAIYNHREQTLNTLLRKQGTSRAELLDALGIKSGNTLTTHINTIKTKMKIIEIREGKFIKYKLELQ